MKVGRGREKVRGKRIHTKIWWFHTHTHLKQSQVFVDALREVDNAPIRQQDNEESIHRLAWGGGGGGERGREGGREGGWERGRERGREGRGGREGEGERGGGRGREGEGEGWQ